MKTLLPLLAACAILPGCIAQEIRDELRAANANLSATNPALGHTIFRLEQVGTDIDESNTRLADVQTKLARTNQQLADVQTLLARTDEHLVAVNAGLDQTRPKLYDLDGGLNRMRILDDVHKSLKEVNTALAPLSKSMGALSSAASLFGIGGEDADLLAQEDAPASDASSNEPAPSPAPATAAPPGSPAPAREASGTAAAGARKSDVIVGTWLLVYPPAPTGQRFGKAMIMNADGTFIEAVPGEPPATGKWSRTKRAMTMTPDPAGPRPSPQFTTEIITLSQRTLTLKRGDEIRVYARP